jgi:hypothetical protein
MAMLAGPKMFSCMATEEAARTSPSPATAHLSSVLICSAIAIYVQLSIELRIPSSLIFLLSTSSVLD